MLPATKHPVILGGVEVTKLRPSLRAATRLAHLYGGIQKIAIGLSEASLSTIATIIREGSHGKFELLPYLDRYQEPIAPVLVILRPQIEDYIVALFDLDKADQANDAPASQPPTSFSEGYERLFSMATGALRWSAKETWNTSPQEIITALEGNNRFMFGASDEDSKTSPDIHPFDRAGLQALKGLGNAYR